MRSPYNFTREEIRWALLPRAGRACFARRFVRTCSIAATRRRSQKGGFLQLFQTNPLLHGKGRTLETGSQVCVEPALPSHGAQQEFRSNTRAHTRRECARAIL